MIYIISALFVVMLVMGIIGIVGLICNFIAIRAKLKRFDKLGRMLSESREHSINLSNLEEEK